MLRIGVDVGGTNTDAVVMGGGHLRAWAKTPTTQDVTSGIVASVREALQRADTPRQGIQAVMIGTTHFTNAVVERRRLASTAVVRLGLPATASVPPLADWPNDLCKAIRGRGFLAHGGYEFDGRGISDLQVEEIQDIAREIGRHGATAVAVCAVFSPVRADQEERAAALLSEILPEVRISLSHEIGRLGLLERENACILNASLSDLAANTVSAMEHACAELGIRAPLYLSQNDGTLMSANFARRYPVLTFASGPTNSMRGAAYLSGLRDALVVDIGGTTTDIGALSTGFPREASLAVSVGGVRTNFRMPDLVSIGIGGGSIIHRDPLRVGPDSVGYRLSEEALVFGGRTFTASDAAAAVGAATFGDPQGIGAAERGIAPAVMDLIRQRIAETVDQIKTSATALPVILVGGGSILIHGDLPDVAGVVRPENYQVANAIGAAIAQVSGEVDHIRSRENHTRADLLNEARSEASARAVEAGADDATLEVVESEDVPLAYLPGHATRVRAKVVGALRGSYVAR
ncbi:MAG: hydantoinase/oxoprolinase family protein [Chloroflexota bacterium]